MHRFGRALVQPHLLAQIGARDQRKGQRLAVAGGGNVGSQQITQFVDWQLNADCICLWLGPDELQPC